MVSWTSPLTSSFLFDSSSLGLGWGGSSTGVAWPTPVPAADLGTFAPTSSPWGEDQLALGAMSLELAAQLPALFQRGAFDPAAGSLAADVQRLRQVLGLSEGRLDPTALASQMSGASPFGAANSFGFPGMGGLDGELLQLLLAFITSVLGQLMRSRDLGNLTPPSGAGGSRGGSSGSGSSGSGPSGSGSSTSTGSTTPTTPTTTATPNLPPGTNLQGLKVEVIGDSLMVGAADKTRGAMNGAGAAGVNIDAQVGRSINGSGNGVNLTPAQIRERAQASGANVVVVELGTNHSDYARFIPETMNELSKIQPPPMVVWVNTQTQRPGQSNYPQSYYDENKRINALIAQEASHRPNMVVADWASIAGGPGLSAGDGLHLTSQGSTALANLITETIARARAAQTNQTN